MTTNDRIYSREEFAEILERAEDFERRAEVALGSQPGFSITQMREIAAEAGIDPDAVERAAHLLPRKAPELPIEYTTRGVLRQRIHASFPVALTDEASAKLLAVIRASSGRQGTGEVTVTGLSWWSDRSGDLRVEVHAEEQASHVEVFIDRSKLLIVPVLAGTVSAWLLASFLDVANASVFFGSIAVGLGIAGTILGTLVNKVKKRTEILMGSIARAMPRLAESTAPTLPTDPIRSRSDRDATGAN